MIPSHHYLQVQLLHLLVLILLELWDPHLGSLLKKIFDLESCIFIKSNISIDPNLIETKYMHFIIL